MSRNAHQLIQDFLKTAKQPLIVILGPTASGKTQLSLELATQFNGEIISADSRQVYRHMDIGTDKIPVDKRKNIPHHMIDVVLPDVRFTVADYKEQTEKIIDRILEKSRVPFIVGGTGLYIRAVTDNFKIPCESQDLEIRKQLEIEMQRFGNEKLHERLKKLDPRSAEKIHPNNTPYLLRALEIILATGAPKQTERGTPNYDVLKIGLMAPREILYDRINRRVDNQMARGLLDEAKQLLTRFSPSLPAMRTLGYRELMQHLNGELALEKAVELMKQHTRNFSKRQMTWWRKEKDIRWI